MIFASHTANPRAGDEMKCIFIFSIILSLCSCSTISKSPHACSSNANAQPIINGKIGTYFLGNIFQYGDCAVSERLRIENGEFLKNRPNAINNQIVNDQSSSKEDLLAVYELFGCDTGNEKPFIDFSKNHYQKLFKNTEALSGREQMLLIRKEIKDDPSLVVMCFH